MNSTRGSLRARRILVGVTGGIAAYKAAELVRLLRREEADVKVIMTRGATQFVTPLTFAALTQYDVFVDRDGGQNDGKHALEHIDLADWAELLVIAPATAHTLARLAGGLADDLLGTVALATQAPLALCPAMNVNMWQHPATQSNVKTLRARKVEMIGPDSGEMACGWVGAGRMAEPAEIVSGLERFLAPQDLTGNRVVVTAGPTVEKIDPVRFLSNRSTGKMGFALAESAARRGAQVVLIAGPTSLPTPRGVERVDVETAEDMKAAVTARFSEAQVLIMAAAVTDFRPKFEAPQKMKKQAGETETTLELTLNDDILRHVSNIAAQSGSRCFRVGFAAETENLAENAAKKLRDKSCDLLVANDVSEPGSGFGTDTNRVMVLSANGAVEQLPQMSKRDVADTLWDRIVPQLSNTIPVATQIKR